MISGTKNATAQRRHQTTTIQPGALFAVPTTSPITPATNARASVQPTLEPAPLKSLSMSAIGFSSAIISSTGRTSLTCLSRTSCRCSSVSAFQARHAFSIPFPRFFVHRSQRIERRTPCEPFHDRLPRPRAELAHERRVIEQDAQRARELVGALGMHEPAVLAMRDHLAHRENG